MTVPIPRRMRHLERDKRGYPIPVIVLRDDSGRPHFTINDTLVSERLLAEDKCPICGTLLGRQRWFVGGPLSAFHPMGRYIDQGMHTECCRYALQACPYLAMPNYARRIDVKTLPADDPHAVFLDNSVIPERPELFVAVLARGQMVHRSEGQTYIEPLRPYTAVEYWRHGRRLDDDAGALLAQQALAGGMPKPRAPRLVLAERRRQMS